MWEDRIHFLAWGAVMALLANFIAWKWRFYSFPVTKNKISTPLTYKNIIFAFLLFFFVEVILIPLIALGWVFYTTGKISESALLSLDSHAQGILNVFAIFLCLIAIALLLYFSRQEVTRAVMGINSFKGGRNFLLLYFKGCAAWLISYPIVIVISQIIALILMVVYKGPHAEQVAVKQLKMTTEDPLLFWLTVFAIIFVVPVIEEILFRGFLQTWLRSFFSRWPAIICASLVFALFHFSLSQKIDNIELLTSLFFLSVYLGIIYEKQQSIWAAVGLHATFNSISILMIFEVWKHG